MNDWNKIRKFYQELEPQIFECDKHSFVNDDAYLWDAEGIELTPIEKWLWHDIRTHDAVFYPQYPVGKFFVDFANPRAKVAIECDGKDFHLDKEKDAARDAVLQDMGWTVYRITGSDCRKDFDETIMQPSVASMFVKNIAIEHGLTQKYQGTTRKSQG